MSRAHEPSACFQDGPFITREGRVLLFESIRPDGFGGADLYVSVQGPNGTWSRAANLGPVVNSQSAERFGRISNDGRFLFFGSDRNGDRADIFWGSVDAVEPLRLALR
ncbi:MAG: PD40 domain-containing protein [Gemmatimonadota bacterium]|nr:MAG: PD40 domain-containing protein [Gemmatimonadota bacterium]